MKNEQLKWFPYYQNNSRGEFIVDADVAQNVFIQAHSADEANKIAESHGIYFDGCTEGTDCSCCGDRWSRTIDRCGTDVPCRYGKPIASWDAPDNGVDETRRWRRFHRYQERS